MGFLENLQNLPEQKRKIILWVVVVIIATSFFIIWLVSVKKSLQNFPKERILQNLELPTIPEDLIKNPKEEIEANMPKLNEEELKELERLLEEEKKQEEQGVSE